MGYVFLAYPIYFVCNSLITIWMTSVTVVKKTHYFTYLCLVFRFTQTFPQRSYITTVTVVWMAPGRSR